MLCLIWQKSFLVAVGFQCTCVSWHVCLLCAACRVLASLTTRPVRDRFPQARRLQKRASFSPFNAWGLFRRKPSRAVAAVAVLLCFGGDFAAVCFECGWIRFFFCSFRPRTAYIPLVYIYCVYQAALPHLSLLPSSKQHWRCCGGMAKSFWGPELDYSAALTGRYGPTLSNVAAQIGHVGPTLSNLAALIDGFGPILICSTAVMGGPTFRELFHGVDWPYWSGP